LFRHILQALQTASQFAYSGLQNVFYRQTLSAIISEVVPKSKKIKNIS